jgi:hypothetical protein
MTDERQPSSLRTSDSAALSEVALDEDGERVVRYGTDSDDEVASTSDPDIEAALSLIGAWSDIDWDEWTAELDRIRHAVPPTPPIEV